MFSFSPQSDYQPIDVASSHVPPVKRKDQSRPQVLPKFDDHTTTKDFYKKWEVEPRKRYVDFHEAIKYVPPKVIFFWEMWNCYLKIEFNTFLLFQKYEVFAIWIACLILQAA